MNQFDQLPALEESMRSIVVAGSPAEVLRILRDGCGLAAPRTGVFLVRKGQLLGWSSIGYANHTAEAQKAWVSPADPRSLSRFRSGSDPLLARGSGIQDPNFAQPTPAESISGVVDVLGKPIAVIVAERSEAERPWHPEAISMLLAVAGLRLELDVVRRKAATATTSTTPQPLASQHSPAPVIPQGMEMVELTPLAEPAPEEAPEFAAARRYARLVATDIRLYNEEAVLLGRRNGDLVRRLGEPIGRGKEAFLQRHGDLGPAAIEVLHEAYVQVLAAGNRQLIPASALE